MPRALAGSFWLAILASWGSIATAQSQEPRGLSFSQGGGFRYAPREHHVIIPSGRVFGTFDFGYPAYGSPVISIGPGLFPPLGYSMTFGTIVSPGYYWPQPLPPSQIPDSPLMPPANALPPQVGPWGDLPIPKPKTDPAERPVLPSPAAARLKAREWMAQGDHDFRQHLWQRAYASYRQAVNLADDLAEAHLRYGIVFAILRRYDRAERHFRRAVFIDPSLPLSDFTLEKLFGPDSKLVRMSILSRIADWVHEDIADPQRLFVLGVLLHFDRDDRAQEFLSAAFHLTGGASHVAAFLPRDNPSKDENTSQPETDEPPVIPPAPLPDGPALEERNGPALPPAP